MALADELKSLDDLHTAGKLTDQEYADAKARTLKDQQAVPHSQTVPTTSRASSGHPIRNLLIVIAIIVGIVWYAQGTRKTTQMVETIVHAPVTVMDAVQSVHSARTNWYPISLPYSGTVEIDIQVVRGNPLDVFVTPADQVQAIQNNDWKSVRTFSDFNAEKSRTYRRSATLQQGNYLLVLRDTSLGILSSTASDVSVKITLNP